MSSNDNNAQQELAEAWTAGWDAAVERVSPYKQVSNFMEDLPNMKIDNPFIPKPLDMSEPGPGAEIVLAEFAKGEDRRVLLARAGMPNKNCWINFDNNIMMRWSEWVALWEPYEPERLVTYAWLDER